MEGLYIILIIISFLLGRKLHGKKIEILNSKVIEENKSLMKIYMDLSSKIKTSQDEIENYREKIIDIRKEYENTYDIEEQKLQENIQKTKEYCDFLIQNYQVEACAELQKLCDEWEEKERKILAEKEREELELSKLKEARLAAVKAALREKEIAAAADFYKIQIDEISLADIETLEEIKNHLRKPEIIAKLIWSNYYQKPTTTLINNVLGVTKVCGIYKITNTKDNMVYIGQSVDIGERWKDHIKNGLGIGNNKFYQAMQKDGVQNFTFELLEQCDRKDLNEREKYWIGFFDSYNFGYNGTKGGS